MSKVMVFGTFDGVHEGHKAFFEQAKQYGEYLIAVVAQDHMVTKFKGRPPRYDMIARMEHLQNEDHVSKVVLGDEEIGVWEVVRRHRPDVIAVGYDQKALQDDLESHLDEFNWHLEVHRMDPHKPERYKSSLLHNGR